jgi:hypothetical protein
LLKKLTSVSFSGLVSVAMDMNQDWVQRTEATVDKDLIVITQYPFVVVQIYN